MCVFNGGQEGLGVDANTFTCQWFKLKILYKSLRQFDAVQQP